MEITVKIEMIVLLKALKLFLGRTLVVNTRNRYLNFVISYPMLNTQVANAWWVSSTFSDTVLQDESTPTCESLRFRSKFYENKLVGRRIFVAQFVRLFFV